MIFGDLLEIERSHRSFQADMELVDLSLREGDDPAAREGDPLEDMRDILLVAGQPVEGFGEEDREPARLHIPQQLAGRIRLAADMPLSLYS